MRYFSTLTLLALVALTVPSLAAAQVAVTHFPPELQSWRPDESLLPSTAVLESGAAVFRSGEDARVSLAVARIGRGGRREAMALMIVGGAGIITGLLVDEGIITIAGAGVAGVGLYLYLR